ncbi:hypothetical protein GCM10010232_69200 [Streptomyces amakusaensis]
MIVPADAEGTAKMRYRILDDLPGGCRRIFLPQRRDNLARGDDAIPMEEEKPQNGALIGSAAGDGDPVEGDFERAENPKTHGIQFPPFGIHEQRASCESGKSTTGQRDTPKSLSSA